MPYHQFRSSLCTYMYPCIYRLITEIIFSPSEFATEGQVCNGELSTDAKSGNSIDYYNHLKEMYSNCTYVRNNVVILALGDLDVEQYPLEFLKDIKEVSGFVHMRGPLPRGLTKLPLESLMIIRGDQLSKYSDDSTAQFSLFVYNCNEIINLGLRSLRGEFDCMLSMWRWNQCGVGSSLKNKLEGLTLFTASLPFRIPSKNSLDLSAYYG